jgi:hypothetical protein
MKPIAVGIDFETFSGPDAHEKHHVYVVYSNYTTEILEECDTVEEAEELAVQYRIAFKC